MQKLFHKFTPEKQNNNNKILLDEWSFGVLVLFIKINKSRIYKIVQSCFCHTLLFKKIKTKNE